MKKWLFFTASAILAIFAFLIYVVWLSCSGRLPFGSAQLAVFQNCASILPYVFLAFSFSSAALFLAFIITSDALKRKHKP